MPRFDNQWPSAQWPADRYCSFGEEMDGLLLVRWVIP